MNTCRFCGAQFTVSQHAIDETRAAYPDEPMTDDEAINIIEVCPTCAGVKPENMTLDEYIAAIRRVDDLRTQCDEVADNHADMGEDEPVPGLIAPDGHWCEIWTPTPTADGRFTIGRHTVPNVEHYWAPWGNHELLTTDLRVAGAFLFQMEHDAESIPADLKRDWA